MPVKHDGALVGRVAKLHPVRPSAGLARILRRVLAAVWLTAAFLPPAHADDRFRFAVWGDMPYSRYERDMALDLLADQAARPLAFSLHVGDLKSGSSRCDDAIYEDRRSLLAGSRHPLVLLAGDNDWLDCSRPDAGGHDPFERLARLRQTLFDRAPPIAGFERHAELPEFAVWMHAGVLFLTLNVPGGSLPHGDAADTLARQTLDWLRTGLQRSASNEVRALVVVFHANPGFAAHAAGRATRRYAGLLDTLTRFAARDTRPMLIVHGDTHTFRNDRPLHDAVSGRRFDHVMRLETPGSPWLGWIEVAVDLRADPPFGITLHRLPGH